MRERLWHEAVRELWQQRATTAPDEAVAERERCLAALAGLSGADRELLLLIAWDGLTPYQAARVLGITRNALGVRLHRARQRLHSPTRPVAVRRPGAVTTEDLT